MPMPYALVPLTSVATIVVVAMLCAVLSTTGGQTTSSEALTMGIAGALALALQVGAVLYVRAKG